MFALPPSNVCISTIKSQSYQYQVKAYVDKDPSKQQLNIICHGSADSRRKEICLSDWHLI